MKRFEFDQLHPDEQIARLRASVEGHAAKLKRLREQLNGVVKRYTTLQKAHKTLHTRLIRERGGHPEQQLKGLVNLR